MNKASVSVGHTRGSLASYRNYSRKALVGADVEARDGLGNVISVHVREGKDGYRVVVNGKTIAEQRREV